MQTTGDLGWWDSQLRYGVRAGMRDMLLHAHRTNDNGGGDSGGGGGGGDGGSGGGSGGGDGNSSATKPEWAQEFGDKLDPDRAWNTIKAQREAERTLKRERDQLKRRLDEIDGANKTESEKLAERLSALENENNALKTAQQTALIRDAVADAARQEGAVYPEDIFKLLDRDAIEVDDGKVKNAAKLVQALKAARPALFGNSSADGNKGRQAGNAEAGDMNAMIRRAAGR